MNSQVQKTYSNGNLTKLSHERSSKTKGLHKLSNQKVLKYVILNYI